MIVLIAAVGSNGVIGHVGGLPWSLPDDMRRFRRLTMGHSIVMGRATYQSIGKPLEGRTNIVLSRDPEFNPTGVEVARDVDEALAIATTADRGDIYVIGGGDIYRQFLPLADRLELTIVDDAPPGDTHFPQWPGSLQKGWFEVASEHHDGAPAFDFKTYERYRQGRVL